MKQSDVMKLSNLKRKRWSNQMWWN